MTPISIDTARSLGKSSGARRLVILAMDDDAFNIVTWGVTRAECRALAAWAESPDADAVVYAIADAEPPDFKTISNALDPGAESALGKGRCNHFPGQTSCDWCRGQEESA